MNFDDEMITVKVARGRHCGVGDVIARALHGGDATRSMDWRRMRCRGSLVLICSVAVCGTFILEITLLISNTLGAHWRASNC